MTYSIFILALTLCREAPDEIGMRGVASVIWESAASHDPAALASECLRHRRYSSWDCTVPSMDMVRAYCEKPEWTKAIRIAKQMATGKFVPLIRATHYAKIGCHKAWMNGMQEVAVIQPHRFMRKGEMK